MHALRKDLDVVRRIYKGKPNYLVRDPVNGEVFELGQEEHFLSQQLDGQTPDEEILRRYEERFTVPLHPNRLEGFVRQLSHQGLLEGTSVPAHKRTLPELLAPEEFIVVLSFPFMGGDRTLGWLARRFGWIFSRPVQWLGHAAIAAGLYILIDSWRSMTGALGAQWGPAFLLGYLVPACLVIRSLRSITHGVVCKHHGGQVREVGLGLLYYVLPSIYCDWWSDLMWIRERSERFWRLASGLYVQALLWAVATIGWWLTAPGTLPNMIFLAFAAAAILTLILASANPLVQMEGYLILSNWLETPRLRERAMAALGAWLYLRPASEPMTPREHRWLIVYGGLSIVYATVIVGIHVWFAWGWLTEGFEGAGALVMIGLAVFALQKPIGSYLGSLRAVRWLLAKEAPARRWLAGTIAAALVAGVMVLPYPYATGGPMRLLPEIRADVRADVEGVVEAVLVGEGDRVEPGQPVARLTRRVHARNLDATEARLAEARSRLELLREGHKPEEVARAESAVRTAETSFAWSRERASRYTELHAENLVSPQDYETAQSARDLDYQLLEESRAHLRLIRSGPRSGEIRALEAEVRRLQAIADNFTADVERTTLVSPIAGLVITPHTEDLAGFYLKPGQNDLVMQIVDARTIQAEVEVPEEEVAGIEIGSPVKVMTWAYHGTTFDGRVVDIAHVATARRSASRMAKVKGAGADPSRPVATDSGDRAIRVITEIPNPDGLLKSEMTGYAKIEIGRRPVWDVLFRPIIRWCMVQVWYWIP